MKTVQIALLLLVASCATAITTRASVRVGPIQKVLSLLEDLKAKISAEGEVEKDQFEQYSKWCDDEDNAKGFAIKTSASQEADLQASIEQLSADSESLGTQVSQLASQVSTADGELRSATELRNQEHADFVKTEKEMTETIDELVRAGSVLRKAGLGGSAGSSAALKAALTQIAGSLNVVLDAAVISSSDKHTLSSLLEKAKDSDDDDFLNASAPKAAAYESHSSSILDTLAELKVKAEKEIADLRKEEANKRHAFDLLAQSLNDKISVQTKDQKASQLEKSQKEEALGVAKGDLAQTQTRLESDRTYLADLRQMCTAKAGEWEERQRARAEESDVLAKAISLLSGDDFQAAVGRRIAGEGFVQVRVRTGRQPAVDVRNTVAQFLQQAADRLQSVGLAQLAVRTRAGDDPFAKVKQLIEDMVARLLSQQAAEAEHNAYCNEETKKSKTKRDESSDKVDDLSTRLDEAEAGTAKLQQEVAELSNEVAEMDKAFADATALRQKESSAFASAIKDYEEGQDKVSAAISVLQDYFAKGDSAFVQESKPKFGGPVFSGAYKKKAGDAKGIVGLLEVAQSDLARMDAEARSTEATAQSAFKELKQQTEVNRATKQAAIKAKSAEVTRVTALIQDLKSDRTDVQKELDAVLAYLQKLKSSCEHQPMPFEERAKRRQNEIDSLQEALRILEGEAAPVALLQLLRRH